MEDARANSPPSPRVQEKTAGANLDPGLPGGKGGGRRGGGAQAEESEDGAARRRLGS